MTGCSKGGHAVLMEAQRFPDDFDGLLPIAPVYDLVGRVIAGAWLAQSVSGEGGKSVIDESAARAVQASMLARCDAEDGVADGVVADPGACAWKPELAACPASGGTSCLTPGQVQAVRRMMAPAV
jgi:feruloyl esterase